jgi:hypothetical protein
LLRNRSDPRPFIPLRHRLPYGSCPFPCFFFRFPAFLLRCPVFLFLPTLYSGLSFWGWGDKLDGNVYDAGSGCEHLRSLPHELSFLRPFSLLITVVLSVYVLIICEAGTTDVLTKVLSLASIAFHRCGCLFVFLVYGH